MEDISQTTKRCQHCKNEYPATTIFFNHNRIKSDGLSHLCKECAKRANRLWSRANGRKNHALGIKNVVILYTKEQQNQFCIKNPVKTCPDCQQKKCRTEEYFHRATSLRDGLSVYCKPCVNSRNRLRKRKITKEEVDVMTEKQNNMCAICGRPNPEHIDHEHASGFVRGLLCESCNIGIGHLKDSPEFCRAAALYLEKATLERDVQASKYIENPKFAGSGIIACVPQDGPCPFGCPDCFANASNSYLPDHHSNIPTLSQARDRIVRMNDANDSNNQRELVIKTASRYKNVFYNTSRPLLDFDKPVVLTINPGVATDQKFYTLTDCCLRKPPAHLMFLRFRTNSWNGELRREAVEYWVGKGVPVVLTFMAYHEESSIPLEFRRDYILRKRTLNSYWAITTEAWMRIMDEFRTNKWVHSCGHVEGEIGDTKCKFCGNCLREFHATRERMRGG